MIFILGVASIFDLRKYQVSNAIIVTLVIWVLIHPMHILFGLFNSILLFFLYFKFSNKIGGADVKIFSCLSFYFGYKIYVVMIISSLIGLLYCIFSNVNKIPFVPFITLGVLYVIFF